MKMISWNVNGLRACIQKGFLEQFSKLDADFFCLQETKLQPGQLELDLPGYEQYWCYAEKKGYSGTAIFTKHTPLSVTYGLGVPELDNEGRLITLEYPEFYLVTCYTPNAQRGLARIEHRMRWDAAFRSYIGRLDQEKPVILCGDLNVAHKEIDLKNPGSNRGNAGFSDEERDSFTKTLDLGFTDTFRYLHPDAKGAYTWWSYMFHARENNAGWRIDYFLVSDRIRDSVYKTPIYPDIMGSDHCPVGLELDIKCNGSIWSPENIGLQTPSVIEIESKSKKKAPALKAGAVAILLLCVLIAGGIAVHHLLPADTSELFSVHVYTTPLKEYLVLSSIRGPVLDDGNRRWSVAEEYAAIDGLLDYRPYNFWIRLDLTDYGKEIMSRNKEIQFSFGDFSVTETSYSLFPNDGSYYTIRAYYDSCYTICGWFIYGFIPMDINAAVVYRNCREELLLTPYTGRDIPTESLVAAAMDNTQLQLAYVQAADLLSFKTTYMHKRAESEDLQDLEYRGFDASQFLFEEFIGNPDPKYRLAAEALLSLDLYFNQLTKQQQYYLLQNCEYHKDERFMDVDLIG